MDRCQWYDLSSTGANFRDSANTHVTTPLYVDSSMFRLEKTLLR